MKVQVLYFGILKDFFEGERDVVELVPGSSVRDLVRLLRGGETGEPGVWDSLAVAVNREYAGAATILVDGDEVALLPPVSGGCGLGASGRAHPVLPGCAARPQGKNREGVR